MKKLNLLFDLLLVGAVLTACTNSDSGDAQETREGPPPDYKSIHETQLEEAKGDSTRAMDLIHVKTGLDVLDRNQFDGLRNKRVGVITNHTGLTKDGRHIVDLLHQAAEVKLVAIFGPEHGVRGVEPDGKVVQSDLDPRTGVPVYSLYGQTRAPTEAMLEKLDILVFDIQDVGARFYTYIYTMALAMEAAAIHGKQFVVLDRPNPITGEKVEGPMLQEGFESFVGLYELPVRHGMTVGELARMFKGEGWIEQATALGLKVVEMTGWKRPLWLDETDVPWVAPSPSMRTLATAMVYPGTCFLEGTDVSEGRGTPKPFEMIGAPYVDSAKLAGALNKLGLPGAAFQPITFTPEAMLPSVPNPKYRGESCDGVLVRVVDRYRFRAVETGVSIVWTIHNLYPENFEWRKTIDRLYGSDYLRRSIDGNLPLADIVSRHEDGLAEFRRIRSKYLLYD